MAKSLRQQVQERLQSLHTERSSFIDHWRELSDYIQPRRGQFLTETNKGTKKNGKIIDNTATIALRVIGAGMMTGLTSPARPWFKLAAADPELNDNDDVKRYLYECERVLYQIFSGSNLYNGLMSVYLECALFGTACMTAVKDPRSVIRYTPLTIGQYYLATDDRGVVDTLYREVRMSVRQVVNKYGINNVSRSTANLYENGGYDKWITVCIAVEPNIGRNPDSIWSKDKPYRSLHWEKDSGEVAGFLLKSGYDRFIGFCPRWHVNPGDIYGTGSPGMDALGDVKQLQTEQRRKGQAIDKMVTPAFKAPASMRNSTKNTMPGGITYVDAVSGGTDGFSPAHEVRMDLNHLLVDIQDVRQRIDSAFYKDVFLMISQENDVRTATENLMRQEEKLLMLGPVLERLHSELHDPLITDAFQTAEDFGMLPPPPEDVAGQPIEIEYISMLAQAQRTVAVTGIERMIGFVTALAQADQSALDKLNVDRAVDEYAEAVGSSPQLIRNDEEVAALRASRADQMAAMQAAQQMQPAADALKKVSEIDTAGNNPIANVLNGQI